MLTANDISTITVQIINIHNGTGFDPIFEGGLTKFEELVLWYQDNLQDGFVAYVRGISYENGERQVLITKFIGVDRLALV